MNIALIVFAGSGSRINSDIPKQFIKINEVELVVYTIKKFNENPHIDEINLVTSKEYIPYVDSFKEKYSLEKVNKVIEGGSTRQVSVRKGLEALDLDKDDNVLIHDGDRPLVSHAIINQAIDYLDEFEVTCPYISLDETIEGISNSGRRYVLNGEEVHIQTPQSFRFGLIKNKHIDKKELEVNDDISLVDPSIVKFYKGDKLNFKVTTMEDLQYLINFLTEKHE